MTIRKDFLIAAGAALILALPGAALAQAQAEPPTPVPPADPVMSAPAQSESAPAAAQAPATDAAAGAAKEYPPCSATVTDSCVQRGGGPKAKGGKSSRRHKT
jgi:hypothetical protein